MLSNDINEAIKKNLSSQVADELQKELNRLVEVEKDYKKLLNTHNELITTYNKLEVSYKDVNTRLINLDKRINNVTIREEAVALREQKSDIQDVSLKCEKEKVELVLDMFKTVFANNTIKTRELGMVPIGVGQASQNTGINYPQPVSAQVDKTTTVFG